MLKYKQLIFDNNFDIVNEPMKIWTNINEIPKNIINFINKEISNIVINYKKYFYYNDVDNNFYCSSCFNKLDSNNYCKYCNKKYNITNKHIVNTSNIENVIIDRNFYVFDIDFDEIILYVLNYKNNKIDIYPFKIKEKCVYSFYNEKFYNYDNINALLKDIFILKDTVSILYTKNLSDLENTTLYKYSSIWDLKNIINTFDFTFETLTKIPICYKEFEYLIKMKLYRLALDSDKIKASNSFKKTFGIDKKYYNFMKENNISYKQLEALRIFETEDINVINFMCFNLDVCNKLKDYVNFEELYNYFKKEKLENNKLFDYRDYINNCKKLKLNLTDKKVLYPKYFNYSHDTLMEEIEVVVDSEIDNEIKNIANMLSLNIYEDDKYIIFPAKDFNSLVDESNQMSNCVRTYYEEIVNGECQIYFMRYKNNINKSLVTVEVRNNKVVQAREKFNEDINEEESNVLKEFEKNLMPITVAK